MAATTVPAPPTRAAAAAPCRARMRYLSVLAAGGVMSPSSHHVPRTVRSLPDRNTLRSPVPDPVVVDLSDATVFVADASTTFCTAVAVTLEAAGFRVCGTAQTADDALDGCVATTPRLCLLDVDLPG